MIPEDELPPPTASADRAEPDEFGDLIDEHTKPISRAARIGYLVAIVPLAIAGLAGLVLPIVPGVALLFLALLLLARLHPRVRHLVNAVDRRLPRPFRRILRMGGKSRGKPSLPASPPTM